MLREEKAKLQAEMDKVTKVATLVGSRLARLVMDARRSSTGNTQLVDELKRYNRRLEVGAARLPSCTKSSVSLTWLPDALVRYLVLASANQASARDR